MAQEQKSLKSPKFTTVRGTGCPEVPVTGENRPPSCQGSDGHTQEKRLISRRIIDPSHVFFKLFLFFFFLINANIQNRCRKVTLRCHCCWPSSFVVKIVSFVFQNALIKCFFQVSGPSSYIKFPGGVRPKILNLQVAATARMVLRTF